MSVNVTTARCRFVSAYLIFECYRNAPIPIIQVTVSARANGPATASINIHPNRHAYKITRGLNAYIVCRTMELGINSEPVDRVMFIGDVTGIQVMARGDNRDYVLQLTDNRKYMAELPTYYLKLIRSKRDKTNGMLYRSPSDTELGGAWATEGYGGTDGIASIYDTYADANFFGVGGSYYLETFFYDIADNKVKLMIDNALGNNTLTGYLKKMLEPLEADKGWEPYYVNMNKKKRITDHLKVYNEGLYQAAISAEFAEAAWQSVKDAHTELHTTYEDALGRLSELGYVFNTNVFPSITGGKASKITLGETATPEYEIKSTLLPGELLNIVKIHKDDTKSVAPDNSMKFAIARSDSGVMRYAKNPHVYSAKSGDYTYYAIIDREKTHTGNNVDAETRITEFTVVPKMYGVLPPKCNWEILREGVTFNAIIGEPPITALKYVLKDGFTNVSVYTCAHPGGLEFYSLYVAPMSFAADPATTPQPLPDNTGGTSDFGRTYSPAIEAAIRNHVPAIHQDIVRAIIWVESRGNPNKKGTSGEIGLMQIIPKYHEVDASRLYEIDYNIWAGYYVFRKYVVMYKNNTLNALAGYNAGSPTTQGKGYAQKVRAQHLLVTGKDLPPTVYVAGGKNTIPYNPAGTANAAGEAGVAPVSQPSGGQQEAPEFDINAGSGHTGINKYMSYGKNKRHFDSENIYGIKRVSTTGSAVYELEKAAQYAEEKSENIRDPVMSRQQKFDMIKQKAKKDFYESTVSQNTGTVVVNGLDEDVLVGLPYVLYYPPHGLFYYGFVEAVTHRVDNSSGEAYTEIGLSSISAVTSMKTIADKFSDYTKETYRPGAVGLKSALAALNKMYAAIAHTENITAEEYNAFDLTRPGNDVKLTNILTARPGSRNICTIERLQKYFYNNELSVAILTSPASNKSKPRQWITPAMRDTVQSLIDEYGKQLATDLQDIKIMMKLDLTEEEEYARELESVENENAGPEEAAANE